MNDAESMNEVVQSQDWLAWLALRHFLPARLLRQTVMAMLDDAGGKLGDYFAEELMGTGLLDENWLLQPISGPQQETTSYWHRRIRLLAGQSDLLETDVTDSVTFGLTNSRLIDFALMLGAAQLSEAIRVPDDLSKCMQPSFLQLVKSLEDARKAFQANNIQAYVEIAHLLCAEPSHLHAITCKHMGDLLLVEGEVSAAKSLYELTAQALSEISAPHEVTELWLWIAKQSVASASSKIGGCEIQTQSFVDQVEHASLRDAPIMVSNASLDAFVLQARANSHAFVPDIRSVTCQAPLLRSSHHNTTGMSFRLKKDYIAAEHEFRAVLRRQLALGLSYDSSRTLGLWGQTFIEYLTTDNSRREIGHFLRGVELLISSGDEKFVSDLSWPEFLVDRFVTENVTRHIDQLFSRSDLIESQARVILTLAATWLRTLGSDSPACENLMYVLIEGAKRKWSVEPNSKLREYSLKLLEDLSKTRTDLSLVGTGLPELIATVIADGGFYEVLRALSLANNFAPRFSHADLQRVLNSVLTLVSRPEAHRMGWPLIRPAMDLLASKSIAAMLEGKLEQRQCVMDTLIRIGSQTDSEDAGLLYQLRNFEGNLPTDISERLADVISKVRKSALNPNRSSAVFHIHALLNVPSIVGINGVLDAITGLVAIIESSTGERTSVSFAKAYHGLRHLRADAQRIAQSLSLPYAEFLEQLSPLMLRIEELWSRAIDFPQIFAEFSFIPTKEPNEVIIHNWAVETLSFEAMLTGNAVLRNKLMDVAQRQPLLNSGIQLAFATMATTDTGFNPEAAAIANESREEFYAKLGRRLVTLAKHDDVVIWQSLVDRCVVLGPRADDAAVFIYRKSNWLPKRPLDLQSYAQRMATDRELRLLLMPLIETFPAQSVA